MNLLVSRTLVSLLFVAPMLVGCGDDDSGSAADAATGSGGDSPNPEDCEDEGFVKPPTNEVIEAGQRAKRPELNDGGNIVGLRIVDNAGQPAETFHLNHPMRVTLRIEPTEEYHHHWVHIGLVEKLAGDADHDAAHTCLLGALEVEYFMKGPGAPEDTPEYETIDWSFVVPEHCLPEGKESGDFNVWVGLNAKLLAPQQKVGAEIDDGMHENNVAVADGDYNTQFFTEEALDLDGKDRNPLCRHLVEDAAGDLIGEDGTEGCVLDIRVARSPGHNVELTSLELDSSVAVVKVAAPRLQAFWQVDEAGELVVDDNGDPLPANEDTPDDRKTPALDAGGAPIFFPGQRTCVTDYATPVASTEGEVSIFGSELQIEPTSDEDFTPTEMTNALDLVGGDGGPAEVGLAYAICPQGEDGRTLCGDGGGFEWADLRLKVGTGRDVEINVPADDQDNEATGEDVEELPVTDVVAPAVNPDDEPTRSDVLTKLYVGLPWRYKHELYLDEAGDTCGKLVDPTQWGGYAAYTLRICADVPFDEAGAAEEGRGDNCRMRTIRLVTVDDEEEGDASSQTFNKGWDKYYGNSVVNFSTGFGTENALNLSGASTHTYGHAGIGGWLSIPLVDIWADANANVSIVGSGVDLGVEVFGNRLWGYQKSIPEYEYEGDKSWAKDYCVTYNYGVAGLGLNVSLCAGATAGVAYGMHVKAVENQPGIKDGQVGGNVEPYADSYLSVSAYLNIGFAKGGVSGTLTVVKVGAPAVATLDWGLRQDNWGTRLDITGNVTLDLEITLMSGSIRGWAELWHPAWCSCGSWCPGYPCGGWSNVWSAKLACFGGWGTTTRLYGYGATLQLR